MRRGCDAISRPANRAPRRRGSIYLTTLAVAAIVAVIGVAAMMSVRLAQHVAVETSDFAKARVCARAGLEMGAYWMKHESNWRTTRGNGTWASDVPMGDGTFTVTASDPVDGDVASGVDDPVVLSSTGKVGEASYTLSCRFEADSQPQSLGVAMLAGGDISVDGGTLSSDQLIAANGGVTLTNGSHVYGQLQAAGAISGSGFANDATAGVGERGLPSGNGVINAYKGQGTSIDYASLAPAGTNLLSNGGFEDGTNHWSAMGSGVLNVQSGGAFAGSQYVTVSNRTHASDGVSQDIGSAVSNGATYHVEARVKQGSSDAVPDARLTVTVWYRPSLLSSVTSSSWSTPATSVGTAWTLVQGDLPVSWTGTLVGANVRVDTVSSTGTFDVDNVSVTSGSGRQLEDVLLSPSSDPVGSGATNGKGVYVIDCGGQMLSVRNCRIVGTLVILNPGAGSTIGGAMNWQAAESNYPALVSNGDLTIATVSTPLSETTLGVNFNPLGTGYPWGAGSGDTDMSDAYPSVIRGVIYDSAGLTFGGSVAVRGVVVSGGGIKLANGIMSIYYDAIAANDPPPAFAVSNPPMRVVAGSVRQVVQ